MSAAPLPRPARTYVKELEFTPDCGNPTGKDVAILVDGAHQLFPAQPAIITSEVLEKCAQLHGGASFAIEVWQDPDTQNIHILDGQHRFVASCIEKKSIKLCFRKYGTPPNKIGWKDTHKSDVTPAKAVLKANTEAAKAQKEQKNNL